MRADTAAGFLLAGFFLFLFLLEKGAHRHTQTELHRYLTAWRQADERAGQVTGELKKANEQILVLSAQVEESAEMIALLKTPIVERRRG